MEQDLNECRNIFSVADIEVVLKPRFSGFVAQKISQTLVSLGIRAGFLSHVDALHSDIGILNVDDILVLFSKSDNTEELLKLVPCVKAKGVYVISITSLESNALMGVCDFNVFLPLERSCVLLIWLRLRPLLFKWCLGIRWLLR
ncbi:hypothetical protein POM88_053073 [Heracleum sosnowskyi]|uniref:SIS domain-containing protein n=1 Tax=Heracleum sosnowskyi TaxID=360622 RepID=A0AAD8GPH9_9APIA|nr:hypothetical protein POM88_053073 [Heracleum sosnowskyi]